MRQFAKQSCVRSTLIVMLFLPIPALAQCGGHEFVEKTEVLTVGNKEVHRIICKCVSGYSRADDGSCVPIAVMLPAKPTVMRAQTRAECVREKGKRLQGDLARCRSPVVDCLTKEGVAAEGAACAFNVLSDGIELAVKRSGSATVAMAAALANCNSTAKRIAAACGPTWGTCQEGPLATFKEAVAACPSQ